MTNQESKSNWAFALSLAETDPVEFLSNRYKEYILWEENWSWLSQLLDHWMQKKREKWWSDTFNILWLMNGRCELSEHISLMQQKNQLYSNEQLIFGGPSGLALRSLDKICRIKTMTRTGEESESEPLIDSMMDLMNYSILGQMLVRGELK